MSVAELQKKLIGKINNTHDAALPEDNYDLWRRNAAVFKKEIWSFFSLIYYASKVFIVSTLPARRNQETFLKYIFGTFPHSIKI